MTRPFRRRLSASTCRALLDLREHDIDRLHAAHEGTLRLILLALDGGHLDAAKAIVREQLG